MKTTRLGAAGFMLCALISVSCSSQPQRSSTEIEMTRIALGELSVDRCFFYVEGEDFSSKSGGDLDPKDGAFGRKCLGNRWGEKQTDYVVYKVVSETPVEAALLVIRAAFESRLPQTYQFLIDDRIVQDIELDPTGGYGNTEKEWVCFSIPLGPIDKGLHSLTIRPSRRGGIINIDCIAIGQAG